MDYEIGKITSFDGHCGKIVSENGEYLFLDVDIQSEKELQVGDLVKFRGENIYGQQKAYFVKYAEEFMIEKSKQKRIEGN